MNTYLQVYIWIKELDLVANALPNRFVGLDIVLGVGQPVGVVSTHEGN